MVSKFFDKLFELADEAKERARDNNPKAKYATSEEYKTIKRVIDTLQNIYDEGIRFDDKHFDEKPKTSAEAIVFGIKQIKIFEDEQDGDICYEIDNKHFDSPTEVMDYILIDRANEYRVIKENCINAMKETLREEIQMRMEQEMDIRFKTLKELFAEKIGE